jgi:hypothetical protein
MLDSILFISEFKSNFYYQFYYLLFLQFFNINLKYYFFEKLLKLKKFWREIIKKMSCPFMNLRIEKKTIGLEIPEPFFGLTKKTIIL